MRTRIVVAALGALLLSTAAHAAEIKVLSTQAVEGAYRELVPQFEKASGHKVTTTFTGTLDAQKRIAAGEAYDLIIMAGPAIDDLIKSRQGRARQPGRSRQVGRRGGRARRRAETRHSLHRGPEEDAARGQIDRLLERSKRRVSQLACSAGWALRTRSSRS